MVRRHRANTGPRRARDPESALHLPASLEALVEVVAELLGAPVTVEDERFRLIAYSRQPGKVDRARRDTILNKSVPTEIVQWLHRSGAVERLHRATGAVQVPACPHVGLDERLAIAIRAGDRVLGHLWVIQQDRPTPEQMRILSQAATSAAVLLLRQEAEATTQARLVREFLIDLLDGEVAGEAAARRRAEALGVELPDRFVVLVADIGAFEEYIEGRDESWVQTLKADLVSTVQAAALQLGERPLLLTRSDSVIIIVGARRPPEDGGGALDARARHLAGVLHEELRRRFSELAFAIGLSRPLAGLDDLQRAYRQATDAARVAWRFLKGMRPAHYEDLGVYRLLRLIADLNRSDGYHNPQLERLEVYDRTHGTSLLATLEAYLDAFGDIETCAATLRVHPNTLRYRIGRIRTIGGLALDDPAVRLTTHLELKVRAIAGDV